MEHPNSRIGLPPPLVLASRNLGPHRIDLSLCPLLTLGCLGVTGSKPRTQDSVHSCPRSPVHKSLAAVRPVGCSNLGRRHVRTSGLSPNIGQKDPLRNPLDSPLPLPQLRHDSFWRVFTDGGGGRRRRTSSCIKLKSF